MLEKTLGKSFRALRHFCSYFMCQLKVIYNYLRGDSSHPFKCRHGLGACWFCLQCHSCLLWYNWRFLMWPYHVAFQISMPITILALPPSGPTSQTLWKWCTLVLLAHPPEVVSLLVKEKWGWYTNTRGYVFTLRIPYIPENSQQIFAKPQMFAYFGIKLFLVQIFE